jgi:hypothetical protein
MIPFLFCHLPVTIWKYHGLNFFAELLKRNPILRPPTLPRQLAPGGSISFTLHFAPTDPGSYSAFLQAGTRSVLMLAKALASATLFAQGHAVYSPGPIDFGAMEALSVQTRRFTLRNQLHQPVTVSQVAVAGAFQIAAAPDLPLTLAPGESGDLQISVTPAQAGSLTGTLRIDNKIFQLLATATAPPLPNPSITLINPNLASGVQRELQIQLDAPARASGAGIVNLSFEPATSGIPVDPAIVLSSGGATAVFNVEPGDLVARFGAKNTLGFQTGTTAGTLVFRVDLGGATSTVRAAVPAAAVGIDSVNARRTSAGVEVQISGFDNTRSASQLTFRFYDRTGVSLTPAGIVVEIVDQFSGYFQSSVLGGIFSVKADFPVSGAADRIGGVELDLVNSAGTVHSDRVLF